MTARGVIGGARLSLTILHEDADPRVRLRCGPGVGQHEGGTSTQGLYDEAKKNGWFVSSDPEFSKQSKTVKRLAQR
jgi:hypothetical protein